jgi:hypothetical protein
MDYTRRYFIGHPENEATAAVIQRRHLSVGRLNIMFIHACSFWNIDFNHSVGSLD